MRVRTVYIGHGETFILGTKYSGKIVDSGR